MFGKIAYSSLATVGFLVLGAAPAQAQDLNRHHYHVEYRQIRWSERTFDSHRRAHQFADLKRSEGFDAHVVHHGDHFHVRFRQLDWRLFRTVLSHAEAHDLQDMLRSRGLEARVIHH